MDGPLPKYHGWLLPASWSRITMTPAVKTALGQAALPGCPACRGEGFLIAKDESAHPCHCTRRQSGQASQA